MRPNMVYYDLLGEDYEPNWRVRSSIMNYPKDVGCSLTSNQILIVGDTNVIKVSNDGGDSFSTISSLSLTDVQCCDIGAHNTFLVGGLDASSQDVFFSNNGGVSWTASNPNFSGSNVDDLSINVNGRCVVIGGNRIYTSTNGFTWTERTAAASLGGGTLECCAVGPNNEIIVAGSVVKISTDGGASWTDRTSASGTSVSRNVRSCHIDELTGKILLGQAAVLGVTRAVTSSDGGVNWVELTLASDFQGSVAACAIYDDYIVTGSSSRIRSSDNSGSSWRAILPSERSAQGADSSRYVMAICYSLGGGLATRKIG